MLLSTSEDLQQRTHPHIFLDHVRLESKAFPIPENVETSTAVEIVWPLGLMQIPDGMRHDEKDQENGT